MKKIKLGILDQSVVRTGSTAKDAIEETIETVILAEKLGYSRFWVSEHHNSKFIAGSAPEILMVKLASVTNKIRIGSGGVMLPNHSAYKVAENFRLLETLFPGRIDLGMGRAPGTDRIASSLLNPSNDMRVDNYPSQINHLQHFFRDTATTNQGRIIAAPIAETIPEQWILSSSGGSSMIAAEYGMGLSVAKFINGHVTREIVDEYRRNFKPSDQLSEPQAFVSIFVVCGETEEIAARMRKGQDFVFLQFEKGDVRKFPDNEFIENYEFTDLELERLRFNAGKVISGTKESVRDQLLDLAKSFDVDEIMISTMSDSKENRLRSFELIAEAFDLKNQVI